nr:YceI family protein [Streptomyces aurantiacus]
MTSSCAGSPARCLTGGGTDAHGDAHVGFTGSVTIDRMDWGVNWNAGTSAMISPKVTLEFDVAAIRES